MCIVNHVSREISAFWYQPPNKPFTSYKHSPASTSFNLHLYFHLALYDRARLQNAACPFPGVYPSAKALYGLFPLPSLFPLHFLFLYLFLYLVLFLFIFFLPSSSYIYNNYNYSRFLRLYSYFRTDTGFWKTYIMRTCHCTCSLKQSLTHKQFPETEHIITYATCCGITADLMSGLV